MATWAQVPKLSILVVSRDCLVQLYAFHYITSHETFPSQY